MQTATDRLDALLHDQPAAPLRPAQVSATQEEITRIEGNRQNGYERSGATFETLRRLRDRLDKQAPKRIEEPARRDEVSRLAKAVLTETIIPSLQPKEIMRRNPSGAVGRYQRTEASRGVKRTILTWKRAMRALDPENADPDYTNVEAYRPELAGLAGAAPTFMADAQIPGAFAMTPAAKQNWPLGDPQVHTAVAGAGYVPADAVPAVEAVKTGVCRYRKCGMSFSYAPLPNGKAKEFCTDKHRAYESTARSTEKAKAKRKGAVQPEATAGA